MTKKINIDNGHGAETAGKRTPLFVDGKQIKEWEFNYPTAKKLGEILKYNGFDVIYSSGTDKDTPLKDRTDFANKNKADLFVSIHYNALADKWRDGVGGIETFHYPTSKNGEKLAKLVQKHLISNTGLRDRGVKTANFYVLRETKMPSILCECGFMDIKSEAELMLNEEYQWKCAKAIAKGICEYFNVPFKDVVKKEKNNMQLYRVRLSWEDSKSQIGAFNNLNTAIELAQQNIKFKVYDEKGNQVYPELNKITDKDKKHWAYKYYENLNDKGYSLTDTRFDDNITRGEVFRLLDVFTDD